MILLATDALELLLPALNALQDTIGSEKNALKTAPTDTISNTQLMSVKPVMPVAKLALALETA